GFAVDDANVEADGDAITVAGDGRRAPVRVLERGGAQVDAGAAGRERGLERVVVTDAPGHLDLDVEGADDLGEQVTVGAATERGVEVHQVDPLGAVGLPLQGGVQRGAVGGLRAGLALDEADRLAVGDVDGGQEFERGSVGHGDHPSPSGRGGCPPLSAGGAVSGVAGSAGPAPSPSSSPYSARRARAVMARHARPIATIVPTRPATAPTPRPAGGSGSAPTATAVSAIPATPAPATHRARVAKDTGTPDPPSARLAKGTH